VCWIFTTVSEEIRAFIFRGEESAALKKKVSDIWKGGREVELSCLGFRFQENTFGNFLFMTPSTIAHTWILGVGLLHGKYSNWELP
jgi:hypothetical protein